MRDARLCRGVERMAVHLRGEGMRRVNQVRDTVLFEIGNEASDAAKAADALDAAHEAGDGERARLIELGRAVARMHSVADDESSHDLVDFSTEEAISKQTCQALLEFLRHPKGDATPTPTDKLRLVLVWYLSAPDSAISRDDVVELEKELKAAEERMVR